MQFNNQNQELDPREYIVNYSDQTQLLELAVEFGNHLHTEIDEDGNIQSTTDSDGVYGWDWWSTERLREFVEFVESN